MRFRFIHCVAAFAGIISAPEVLVSGLAGQIKTIHVPPELDNRQAFCYLEARIAEVLECSPLLINMFGTMEQEGQILTMRNYTNCDRHVNILKTRLDSEYVMKKLEYFRSLGLTTEKSIRSEYSGREALPETYTIQQILGYPTLHIGYFSSNIYISDKICSINPANIPEHQRLLIVTSILSLIQNPGEHMGTRTELLRMNYKNQPLIISVVEEWAKEHPDLDFCDLNAGREPWIYNGRITERPKLFSFKTAVFNMHINPLSGLIHLSFNRPWQPKIIEGRIALLQDIWICHLVNPNGKTFQRSLDLIYQIAQEIRGA